MLDGRRVANTIGRLLLAGACMALIWLALADPAGPAVIAGLAFAGAAVAFLAWQRLAPTADARRLMSTGLCGSALLVVFASALAGASHSPFLLFLIWLVPWAFVTWSRARALAFVAALAIASAALLATQSDGGLDAFARDDLSILLVGMGGLVAIGLAVRLVVDRLVDSRASAQAAAVRQALVADLARRGLDVATTCEALEREATSVVVSALGAERARVVPVAAAADPGGALLLPISTNGRVLEVVRRRPFSDDETAFARVVAEVLAVAASRVRAEDERRERAGRDELTGLAGRESFAEQLAAVLASDGDGDGAAVLVVDIDDFVLVNETLGPAAGDELLRGVGRRLRECAGEQARVARFGGDEFALFDPSVSRHVLAVDLAKRVQACLRAPFEIAGSQHHVTASIGIAVCDRGRDPRGAIRDAHLAQRRAREHGRGRYEVFNSGLRQGLEHRRSIEQELRRALEQREFRLVYQPVVELGSGRIRGVEALLRWQHPERGLIAPAEFIEVAEATDLILPIGAWALRESLRQLKAWERGLPGLGNLHLGVNVSARQLADGRFVPLLRRQLGKYEIDPACVTCELTETALTDESPQVEAAVGQIKALGVQLALDDFGTGYASLRYVRRFDFDALKLDRSFVAGLGSDADDTALVAAAISMGGALNMDVIAEGVEREDQAARLRAMGCALAQGFLFARPMDAASVRALIVAQRRRDESGSAADAGPGAAPGARQGHALGLKG
jgi:diguanylate cyclase (GGDEF)-like protein